MAPKLKAYAVLIWCVLYLIFITGVSIAFLFSPQPHRSMLLAIGVVLLLVTLLQVHLENLDYVVYNRDNFKTCNENTMENSTFFEKLPPMENLVAREDSTCVFHSDSPITASCPNYLKKINPQKLKLVCGERTSLCTEDVEVRNF
jgi:hypothetical protein